MLYLKSMSIEKFKSFKHASMLFNKGFNCIVGPNGSGKSNIGDAILFSLGESSLRRLRVRTLDQLINSMSNRKPSGLAKSHVRLEFAGDERIEITRGVRADGKTAYRLNGKRMTRQEVLEVLKKHNVHVDETSTIAQNEINKLIDLNPKERRELIDLAAGIKEFEHKKKEAMSELEKVGIKVSTAQATLNERLGFLKELEKEKEAAEKYLEMSKRMKELKYSILAKRKSSVQGAIKGFATEVSKLEEKKKALEERIAGTAKRIIALGEERQKITKLLSEGSDALGGTNKKLTDIGDEINALEVRIGTGNASIDEASKLVESIKNEIEGNEKRIDANEAEIASLKSRINELEASAENSSKTLDSDEAAVGIRIKELSSSLQSIEKNVADLQDMLSSMRENGALLEANRSNMQRQLSELKEKALQEGGAIEEARGQARAASEKKTGLEKSEKELQEQIAALGRAQCGIDSELIELKQQRALAKGRDSSAYDRLRNAFGKQDGFYGTAVELCSYDSKYAEAIEAAAGSHFNYFVVESIDVANLMIQYLRKNGLGRATFIPLRELSVADERREKDLQSVRELLSYDPRFERAFVYLFNNTYLVNDLEEAKRLGVGRCRYVTISGETVEKSGILSGGSRSKTVPLAALDKRLAELEKTKIKLVDEISESNEMIFSTRKEIALLGMQISSLNNSCSESDKRLEAYGGQRSMIEEALRSNESELHTLREAEAAAKKEAEHNTSELKRAREEMQKTYDETMQESLEASRKGMSREKYDESKRIGKELEELKIRSAEIQKENAMLRNAVRGLEDGAKEKRDLISRTQKEVGTDLKKKAELNKAKGRMEEEIKKSGESTKEAYERLGVVNADLDVLNNEQGSSNTSSEGISKQVQDAMVKKGQMEVRLNDIIAELSTYGNAEIEIIDYDVEDMEKEVSVLGARVGALGNVNLKAPEAYEEKARSVEEATEKMNTLEAEKRAVLSMIEEIDSKKLNAFITTFNEVNKNFGKLYTYIFPGAARIELENVNLPLESGLDIKIEDGKNQKRLGSLSGGERSLISLMLIFSIHMCKPSALYLFDEIDSALDKENSKKLSQLIREMAKEAQFVVVSHNDSLIVNADAAIGVVKTDGVSKVVGIEISSNSNK